jgi:inorganic pyrophosphatase
MDSIQIIIETPGGSRAKFKYNKKKECMEVKKLLPAGMVFPYDFGYIPGTKGEDDDPVDAMVIAEFNSFPGCHISCRLIGALLAEQQEAKKRIRNDRYFFVPDISLFFEETISLTQLTETHIRQLTDFFINYNRAEEKQFIPLKVVDADEAWKLLKKQK